MTMYFGMSQSDLDRSANNFWQVTESTKRVKRSQASQVPLIDIVNPQPKTPAKVFYSALTPVHQPKTGRTVRRKRGAK